VCVCVYVCSRVCVSTLSVLLCTSRLLLCRVSVAVQLVGDLQIGHVDNMESADCLQKFVGAKIHT